MMFAVFKLIHILAVIVFIGNITIGLFWKRFADGTKDPKIIAHTIEGIIRADKYFTIPGIFVIIAGGVATAMAEGYPILGTGWILWGIVFFVIAGIAFGPVSRSQRAMLDIARGGVTSGKLDWAEYHRRSITWDVFGSIALIAPLIAVALMVLKPELPALHF